MNAQRRHRLVVPVALAVAVAAVALTGCGPAPSNQASTGQGSTTKPGDPTCHDRALLDLLDKFFGEGTTGALSRQSGPLTTCIFAPNGSALISTIDPQVKVDTPGAQVFFSSAGEYAAIKSAGYAHAVCGVGDEGFVILGATAAPDLYAKSGATAIEVQVGGKSQDADYAEAKLLAQRVLEILGAAQSGSQPGCAETAPATNNLDIQLSGPLSGETANSGSQKICTIGLSGRPDLTCTIADAKLGYSLTFDYHFSSPQGDKGSVGVAFQGNDSATAKLEVTAGGQPQSFAPQQGIVAIEHYDPGTSTINGEVNITFSGAGGTETVSGKYQSVG